MTPETVRRLAAAVVLLAALATLAGCVRHYPVVNPDQPWVSPGKRAEARGALLDFGYGHDWWLEWRRERGWWRDVRRIIRRCETCFDGLEEFQPQTVPWPTHDRYVTRPPERMVPPYIREVVLGYTRIRTIVSIDPIVVIVSMGSMQHRGLMNSYNWTIDDYVLLSSGYTYGTRFPRNAEDPSLWWFSPDHDCEIRPLEMRDASGEGGDGAVGVISFRGHEITVRRSGDEWVVER